MEVINNFTQIWNEINISSLHYEKVYFFSRDYFKGLCEEKMNTFYYSYSHSVINFLGVPLPIGERIYKCFKKETVDFIVIDEFLMMIKVFFMEDIQSKSDFFFKMMDFDNDKIIHIYDMLLFFQHLNYGAGIPKDKADIFIKNFFVEKTIMTLADYQIKIITNCDVVLLFYYSVFNTKSFNEDVIEYYDANIYSKKKNQEVTRKVQSVKCMPLYKGILKKNRKSCINVIGNKKRSTVNFSPIKTRSDMNITEFSMKSDINEDVYRNDYDKGNDCFNEYNTEKYCKDDADKEKERIEYDCTESLLLYISDNYKVKSACFIIHGSEPYKINTMSLPEIELQKQPLKLQSVTSNSTTNALENDNDNDDDNDDLEQLNNFEKDKQASFHSVLSIHSSKNKITYHTPKKETDSKKNNCYYPYHMDNNKSECKSAKIKSPIEKSFMFTKVIDSPNKAKSNSSKSNLEFINVQDNNLIRVRLVIADNFLFVYSISSLGHAKQIVILLKEAFLSQPTDTSIIIYSSSEKEYLYTFPNNQQLQQFMAAFKEINPTNIPFEDQYNHKEDIGHGQFGKITLVQRKEASTKSLSNKSKKQSKWFCLKTINKKKPFFRLGKWEGYISKYLSIYPHENIIKVYEVYEDAKKIQILMEYDSIETLDNVIYADLSIDQTKAIMSQLTNAIDFLHLNGIVHRDIKLENIILNEDTFKIKVIDFGLSKVLFPTDTIKEKCGTLSFTAPEIIMDKYHSKKVDMWSIGIIAYIFEYHKFPYDKEQINFDKVHNEVNQLMTKVLLESDFYWHESFLRMIVRNTLLKNPDDRYTTNDLMELCRTFKVIENN